MAAIFQDGGHKHENNSIFGNGLTCLILMIESKFKNHLLGH